MAKASKPAQVIGLRLFFLFCCLVFGFTIVFGSFSLSTLLLLPLVIIVAVLFAFPIAIRRAVLAQMGDDIRFPEARGEDFPNLDQETMARYSAELESLGFVPHKSFAVETDSPNATPGFARHFWHPQHHCLGEINQMFPRNLKPMRVTCVILSWFGTEGIENQSLPAAVPRAPLADPGGPLQADLPEVVGYSYTTHNRQASSLANMLRHERALLTRVDTRSAAELLQVHLARRQQISTTLGLPPVQGDLSRIYFAFSARLRPLITERIRRRDPWSLLIQAISQGKKPEWMGELAAKIKE